MSDFTHPLGDTVKSKKKKQELTQAQVADSIDIDMRTVLNIENYKGNPKMEILFPLIRVLRIDPNEIFYPERQHETSDSKYLRFLIESCSEQEAKTLIPVIEAVLSALRSTQSTKIE